MQKNLFKAFNCQFDFTAQNYDCMHNQEEKFDVPRIKPSDLVVMQNSHKVGLKRHTTGDWV